MAGAGRGKQEYKKAARSRRKGLHIRQHFPNELRTKWTLNNVSVMAENQNPPLHQLQRFNRFDKSGAPEWSRNTKI